MKIIYLKKYNKNSTIAKEFNLIVMLSFFPSLFNVICINACK